MLGQKIQRERNTEAVKFSHRMDPSNEFNNPEEFEKVDKIPEQDEEVTTTSFSGETVEADRYEPDYSPPPKTGGAETTENLLDFGDDSDKYRQNPPTDFDHLLSSNEPLKPSAPPASGFDLLGDSETYENKPITSSSEKETPVKPPERKEAVAAPAGNGSTASIIIMHHGSMYYVVTDVLPN